MSTRGTFTPALLVGVAGEGVTPTSFDVARTLEYVHAFVSLVEAIAEQAGDRLELTGLEIRPGSAAFAIRAKNTRAAREHARTAERHITGTQETAQGLQSRTRATREALQRLPASHEPFVRAGRRRVALPREFSPPEVDREVTSVRVRVVSVGGVHPRVRVRSAADGLMSLQATVSLARSAAQSLYREIDATVTIMRAGGKVSEAILHDFDRVEELAPEEEIERWRAWFATAGAEWEDVDDIEVELGRESLRR